MESSRSSGNKGEIQLGMLHGLAVIFQKLGDSRSQKPASDSAGEKEPEGADHCAKFPETPCLALLMPGFLLWIGRRSSTWGMLGIQIPIGDPAWQRISLPDPSVYQILELPHVGKHLLGALVAVFRLKLQTFLQDLI